jgi:hypothetical protein
MIKLAILGLTATLSLSIQGTPPPAPAPEPVHEVANLCLLWECTQTGFVWHFQSDCVAHCPGGANYCDAFEC